MGNGKKTTNDENANVDSHNYNCWLWLKSVNDKLHKNFAQAAKDKFLGLANIQVPRDLSDYPNPEGKKTTC